MKRLGAYIGDSCSNLEKNTFVWYEVIRELRATIKTDVYTVVYTVSLWSIKGGYPNGRKPDAKFNTTYSPVIDDNVIPMKVIPHKYCIEWENQQWQIKDCTVLCDYRYGHEFISTLKVDQFGSNNYSHWEWGGDQAISVLKNVKVNRIYEMTPTIPKVLKEELKKSLEQDVMKSALNSFRGGFTTTNDFISNRVLSVNEALEIWENKNKETKTMEKKTMTATDTFLKHINGITITSTYSKLDFGDFGDPYYIYYPEMEITESIADTLLTILLMAKREYIHKVVFNPKKGTTTISKSTGDPVTVRCKDGEFDYILGYEMARSKMYLGHNDYNWFNKIKNHRKTRIEYTEKPTEPKTKKTSKKGGKK